MNAVVIEARTQSDVRFLRDFSKRIGARVIDANDLLEDMAMCRLIEEGLKDPEFVSREEIMKVLEE